MATTKKLVKTDEDYPLNILLKFIKPYDGSRNRLNAFINNCNNAHELVGETNQDFLLRYIISQLEGRAEQACSIKEFDTWSSLKEFLKAQFGDRKHYAHLLMDLQECKQAPNEMISDASGKARVVLEQTKKNMDRTAEDLRKAHPDVEKSANALREKLQAAVQNTIQESQKLAKEIINREIKERKYIIIKYGWQP